MAEPLSTPELSASHRVLPCSEFLQRAGRKPAAHQRFRQERLLTAQKRKYGTRGISTCRSWKIRREHVRWVTLLRFAENLRPTAT